MTKRTLIPFGLFTAAVLIGAGTTRTGAGEIDTPAGAPAFVLTAQGELQRPTGYREWIYVGAPLTPNDMNNGKAAFPEFHNVYIHPKAWEAWRRTGEFPDGTILVKESWSA
ncbi:MAG: cytochrome P460 family protein [Beijerinckiaceae bacterium]|nr:cytochrome P460 family protein [Beijerinckiaceae bacterium]